jgi:hypothetical protein
LACGVSGRLGRLASANPVENACETREKPTEQQPAHTQAQISNSDEASSPLIAQTRLPDTSIGLGRSATAQVGGLVRTANNENRQASSLPEEEEEAEAGLAEEDEPEPEPEPEPDAAPAWARGLTVSTARRNGNKHLT